MGKMKGAVVIEGCVPVYIEEILAQPVVVGRCNFCADGIIVLTKFGEVVTCECGACYRLNGRVEVASVPSTFKFYDSERAKWERVWWAEANRPHPHHGYEPKEAEGEAEDEGPDGVSTYSDTDAGGHVAPNQHYFPYDEPPEPTWEEQNAALAVLRQAVNARKKG